MNSNTITIQLAHQLKANSEKLAEATRRDKPFLAAEAAIDIVLKVIETVELLAEASCNGQKVFPIDIKPKTS